MFWFFRRVENTWAEVTLLPQFEKHLFVKEEILDERHQTSPHLMFSILTFSYRRSRGMFFGVSIGIFWDKESIFVHVKHPSRLLHPDAINFNR